MRVAPSQQVIVAFRVKDSDGALVDADTMPTAVLYRNGFATAIAVTVEKVTGAGRYRAVWTNDSVSTAGMQYQLEVTATVSGTSYSALVWQATLDAVPASGASLTDAVTTILNTGNLNWVTATGFATYADVDSLLTDHRGALQVHGDANWATATGFATPADVSAALAAYDGPTKAELDAALTEIKGVGWSASTDTLERIGYFAEHADGQLVSDVPQLIAALQDHGDAHWVTATGFSTHSAAAAATAVRAELATELARLDATVSSRLAALAAPPNFAALGINASGHISRVTLVDTTTTNSDMRGTDGAALAGSEMTLTAGERAAIAVAVEAALLNDGDGQALVDAIISRIESDLDASDVTVQAIAAAVRDEVFDRVLALNHDIAGSFGRIVQDTYVRVDGLDDRLTEARAEKLDRDLAETADVVAAQAAIVSQGNSAWTTATGFSTHTAAAAAVAVRDELAAELERIDTTVSSRLAGSAAPANFGSLGITPEGHIAVAVGTPTQTFENLFGAVFGEMETYYTLLRDRGDEAWITATGFATPADVASALAAYDAPTKAEMDAALSEIKGTGWNAGTDTLERIGHFSENASVQLSSDVPALFTWLQGHGDANWVTATGFAEPGDEMRLDMAQQTPSGSTVGAQLDAAGTGGGDGVLTAADVWAFTTRTLTSGAGLNDLSAADIDARLAAYDAPTRSELDDAVAAIITQGNQAWATATGFAVPADITAAREAIVQHGDSAWTTATGFVVPADITAALDAIIQHGDTSWATATGFAVAADITAAHDAIIQHGDSAWMTATGFAQPGDMMRIDMSQPTPDGSTVGAQLDAAGTGSGGGGGATAAQIWSYANRTLTSGDNLDTLSADDLDARLPANFSQLQINAEGRVESTGSGAGADAAEVWSYFVASTGDAAVARIAAATGGASSASHRISVTVEDQTGSPVMHARVALAGSAVARYTDQFGRATLFAEAGEYELIVLPPFGFQTPDPKSVAVAGEDQALTVILQREVADLEVPPGTCAVTLQVFDQTGLPLEGLEVSHKISAGFAVLADQWLVNAAAPAVTDTDGVVHLVAARGQVYDFTARVSDSNLVTIRRLVPDAESATLSMMVEA